MRFRDKNLRIAYMPELVRGVYKAGAVFTKRARHSQSGRGVYKAGAADQIFGIKLLYTLRREGIQIPPATYILS